MALLKTILRWVFRWKILVPLALVAVLVWGGGAMQKRSEEAKANRYRTATVDRGAVVQRITANGTVNPVTVVAVGTQVSGAVTKLYTDFNRSVRAGDVLLELDPALIKANIAQLEATRRSAEATQRLAESTLKRNQELVRKGFISDATLESNQKELDVAKAQVAQALSQIDREKTNLGYTVIRSPINGIVIDRQVDVGQTVAASFNTPTLFRIAQDLTAMQIDTSVAEADVGSVREGMNVRFSVDAYPERDFQGTIRLVRLNPTIQQNVVTYNVVVDVRNDDATLKPGMTAQVNFVANQKQDVVRIPNAALRFKPPKDDKDDRKNDKKGAKTAEKKKDGDKSEKMDKADKMDRAEKPDAKTADAANTDAAKGGDARLRRPPARVFKLNDKNELVPVEIRTGIASTQHTELVSGDIKPGDELVIRDLMDKANKK